MSAFKTIRIGQQAQFQGSKAINVAPGRGNRARASYWKFWTQKNDIYVIHRGVGTGTKLSVHESGQIHAHIGPRNTQQYTPLMPVGDGLWMHAFEMRFLLSTGADAPPEWIHKLKRNAKAAIVQAADGEVLYLNLFVSAAPSRFSIAPPNFIQAPEIWRTSLADGRVVVLIGRVLPMDEQCSNELRYIRSERQPKANFTGEPPAELPYTEIVHTHWGPHGNFIVVTPMGPEGRRFDPDVTNGIASDEPQATRPIQVHCPEAAADLVAPDQSVFGSISIVGLRCEVGLIKGQEVIQTIGRAAIKIYPLALRPGESFERPRFRLPCALIVGGMQAHSWGYTCEVKFDGATVSVGIASSSAGLRNLESDPQIREIDSDEEIVIRAPVSPLVLRASREAPAVIMDLQCGFRLRDS